MNIETGESQVFEWETEASVVATTFRPHGAFEWPPGHSKHYIYAAPTIDPLKEVEAQLKRARAVHDDP